MVLKKQQIQWARIERNPQEHWKLLSSSDSCRYKVVIAMKSVEIILQLVSDIVLVSGDRRINTQYNTSNKQLTQTYRKIKNIINRIDVNTPTYI